MEFESEDTGFESDDSVIVAFESEMGDVIDSEHEAMHRWLAAENAAVMLKDLGTRERLVSTDRFVDSEWVMNNWPEDDEDALHVFLDKLGDASKLLLRGLAADLTAAGLPNLRLITFLQCHNGPATVIFKGVDELPEVRIWPTILLG